MLPEEMGTHMRPPYAFECVCVWGGGGGGLAIELKACNFSSSGILRIVAAQYINVDRVKGRTFDHKVPSSSLLHGISCSSLVLGQGTLSNAYV